MKGFELIVVNDLNLVKKQGKYKCISGTHEDKNYSMSYWDNGNKFHCFACGFNYDEQDHRHNGYKFAQNTTYKPKVIKYDKPKSVKLFKDLNQYTINYFKKRGISKQILDSLQIKQANNYKTIVIPYYDEFNNHVTNKYRDITTKKIYFDKNTNCKTLYNINNAEFGRPLYITEGESDLMSILEIFKNTSFKNVVSVPTGANVSWIDSYKDYLTNFTKIIFCMDNDKAGDENLKRFIDRIKSSSIKFNYFNWEVRDIKDINDYLIKDKKALTNKLIDLGKN